MGGDANEVFDVGSEAVDPNLLPKLQSEAKEVAYLDREIERLDDELAALRSRRHHCVSVLMPDLMMQLGMDSFTLSPTEAGANKGVKFTLGTYMRSSWPKDPAGVDAAVSWLEEHDGAEMIKDTLTARFGRDQHEQAQTATNVAREFTDDVELVPSVHASTLKKFVRERLEAGEQVDFDVLNISTGRIVQVKAS